MSPNNYAPVTASGSDSRALVARSIGGGGSGGWAGTMAAAFSGGSSVAISEAIRAAGGSGGNGRAGGNVNVTNTGALTTRGDRAPAISVTSIGGSSSANYTISLSVTQPFSSDETANLLAAIGGSGGTGATGAGVTVDNSAEISTGALSADGVTVLSGCSAHSIVAMSIGGGCGVGGYPGCSGAPCGYAVGPSFGFGNEAAIVIELESGSRLETMGQYSHAIFAQSAASGSGSGTGGPVTITVSGSVTASGDGASGIFASPSGPGGKGQLTVNVQAGSTVSGGTGNAAGIRLVDGAAIRVDRASSSAIGTVQTTVTNTGTIIGQVLAGPHAAITVDNQQGGTVVTGPAMVLGAGGTMTKEGTLEVGGRRIAHTAMQGMLVRRRPDASWWISPR